MLHISLVSFQTYRPLKLQFNKKSVPKSIITHQMNYLSSISNLAEAQEAVFFQNLVAFWSDF